MNYLYLALSCGMAFLFGFPVSEQLSGSGAYWFLGKSTISCFIILAAMAFSTAVSMPIAMLELLFIVITLFAAIGYLTDYLVWYYSHYLMFMHLACYIELALLIIGIPYAHIFRRCTRFFSFIVYCITGYHLFMFGCSKVRP